MSKNKAYRLVVYEYDANWNERIRELGRGAIMSQGQLLFEGWKKKLGPMTIKLTLVDEDGNVEDEYDQFR